MKKTVLIGVLLSSALAVSVYAHSGESYSDQGMMGSQNGMQGRGSGNCQGNRGGAHSRQNMGGINSRGHAGMGGGMMGLHMFAGLNLTPKQGYELSMIKGEMRLNMRKIIGYNMQSKMLGFINDEGFDKQAFEKYANSIHKKMLENRANSMEKAFHVLTKEQIVELKKNIAK